MTENNKIPAMSTLTSVMKILREEGYIEDFTVKNAVLIDGKLNSYNAPDIVVDNYYRFEGESDPSDNAILYAISTQDGHKGILIDAYGTYSDSGIDAFIQTVKSITKEVNDKK